MNKFIHSKCLGFINPKRLVNKFIFLTFLFLSTHALAEVTQHEWKIFESDYGFSFKHPDCWSVNADFPNQAKEKNLKIVTDLFLSENDICKTKSLDSTLPNGISLSIPSKPESPEKIKKAFEMSVSPLKIELKSKRHLISKVIKVDGNDAILYFRVASKWENKIRFQMELFCPKRKLLVGGPNIQNPDHDLLKKFESGEFAIPEPYKTIIESIRCTEPKIKN